MTQAPTIQKINIQAESELRREISRELYVFVGWETFNAYFTLVKYTYSIEIVKLFYKW